MCVCALYLTIVELQSGGRVTFAGVRLGICSLPTSTPIRPAVKSLVLVHLSSEQQTDRTNPEIICLQNTIEIVLIPGGNSFHEQVSLFLLSKTWGFQSLHHRVQSLSHVGTFIKEARVVP